MGSLKLSKTNTKTILLLFLGALIGLIRNFNGLSDTKPDVLKLAESDFRICTQNIHRLGADSHFEDLPYKKQRDYLVKRIVKAKCSIVALQEVPQNNSEMILEDLAHEVSLKNGKKFEVVVGKSNTRDITNGYIVSKDNYKIKEVKSFHDSHLPKFDRRERPWSYTRGPLALTLVPKIDNSSLEIFIVNDHLKSKAGGWKDQGETNFENLRVLSAAGIKKELENRRSSKTIEIFLGDRNADGTGASSLVLSGRIHLDDFQGAGKCEISPQGSALCSNESFDQPDMIPVLETASDKSKVPLNSFKYGRKEELLDEIYVFKEDGHYFMDKVGRFKAGVEGEYNKGSDHLLTWVELSLDADVTPDQSTNSNLGGNENKDNP